ncbi:unnamed protein product [Candida parapsilosis]|uniref:DUF7082 domain-containing protein n=1 Tax=Candida parapsilosis (strain CDC 317 / ATCC MYA-4646) TaxID=578454 RepID=G8B5W0_CANPC|nr:uncharacterized protein CPAR2_109270 [Candida parapsilosis]KAI5905543.1 hypothetical protein K4G60_g4803 [Candida parapsilosis]CAD1810244.1 unnamed protein product [Candida parapsilosis]CCE40889.1 hypothetical protein CPAR2_109270 [Candida parapsilosis]
MFIASSPILQFNRFDMLDPNDYDNSTNNSNFSTYAIDESVHDEPSAQGFSLNPAAANYLLGESHHPDLFTDDSITPGYVAAANVGNEDASSYTNNLYTQSINVNLGEVTPQNRAYNNSSSFVSVNNQQQQQQQQQQHQLQQYQGSNQPIDSFPYQSPSSQYHYPLASSVSSSIHSFTQQIDAGHSSSYNFNYPTNASSLDSQYPQQGSLTTSVFHQPPPLPISSSSPPQFVPPLSGSQSQSVYFDGVNAHSLGGSSSSNNISGVHPPHPPQPPPLSTMSSSSADQLSYTSSPGSVTTTRQQMPEKQLNKKSPTQRQRRTTTSKRENKSPVLTTSTSSIIQHPLSDRKRYRVLRGVSAGGSSTRPPKEALNSDSIFLPVELNLVGASVEDICCPKWSTSEKQDRRRVIRIERIQNGPQLTLNFSIVGSADENPITLPAPPNVDVVEVSCLECDVRTNDDYESQSSDDETGYTKTQGSKNKRFVNTDPETGRNFQYYITSVEVIEIVELLIGTAFADASERRRERGRVRSNLVPFWSKKSISSRMSDSSSVSSSTSLGSNSVSSTRDGSVSSNSTISTVAPTTASTATTAAAAAAAATANLSLDNDANSQPTNQDYRMELAKRIMAYDIRKPRGFDKEVRILRWDKLIPALKRASHSYYTEIPPGDELHTSFSNFDL